ncbi:sugar transferase [Sphingomonas koreensis]|uniref:sugar transferase n=1 Tax=Sphingomonas koreensis TaxID=93064 RepID=UPI000F7DF4CD|nr:sugar transferase [Sphingomonas koreensis]
MGHDQLPNRSRRPSGARVNQRASFIGHHCDRKDRSSRVDGRDNMMIIGSASSRFSRLQSHAMEQRSFQAIAGVLLAVVLPGALMLTVWPPELLLLASVQNTILAVSAAFVGGLLWYRRLGRHPGVQGLENVLTAFITTFAVAAAMLLLLRIDYSRVYFFTSFVFTLGGFALMSARASLTEHLNFHVIPFGSYERLLQIPNGSWTVMASPALPKRAVAGIVADLRADMPDEWEGMMADAVLSGVPVFHIKQIEEALSGRVDIEHMSENQFGSLLPNLGYRKLKTVSDALIALALLPFLLPFFAIVALLIKLDSPGPVFYMQPRIGMRGRPFQMYKFRSMRNAVPGASNDARSAAMTLSDDARITRLGRIIRQYRIDELPQILNVLRGEMSWVGPRPEAVALSEWYLSELPFYKYRHIVKPGLTGWAQVNQGHVTDLNSVHEKLRFDFYYIKYFSIWLDLVITIRTVRIVLSGFGAK